MLRVKKIYSTNFCFKQRSKQNHHYFVPLVKDTIIWNGCCNVSDSFLMCTWLSYSPKTILKKLFVFLNKMFSF